MDLLDELLKTFDHAKRAPLPDGFEAKVVNKWFEMRAEKKTYPFLRYAVAVCLIICTSLNIYYLSVQTDVATDMTASKTDSTFETQLINEYGLAGTNAYYSSIE
ncbi:MAG: hypothetical protein ACTHJT_14675 [Cytophaga sp.]|uniref:hypothetical protein n=1 Tax=Cytophaga sp. TaxID=29535 RepID=UPI003F822D9B